MYGTQTQSQFKTLIYEEELERIAGWVEEYPNLETGGDLFGFWTHSGAPVVQYVLGPGSGSRHNSASFYQDRDHLIKAGEILRNKHGLQHIGEWHSHHQLGVAEPSGGDTNTVIRALQRYNFPRFLLCIANIRPNSGRMKKWNVNVGCFLYSSHQANYQAGAWVVLPGESPIRSTLGWSSEFNRTSRRSKGWTVNQTTLEQEPLVTTEPIEVSDKLWYSTQQGQSILKEIFDKIQIKFQQCKMFQTNEHRIYLTFECQCKHGYQVDRWRVEFPENFPEISPQLHVNNENHFGVKNWSENHSHFEQIEDCINRHYDKR
ncbi:hypothetical protein QUB63_05090 [Microcoleus sp. ARI1-B5]|uniref:hypothetical protein n=1 Tax=unclassified Microcoleus TaxID=2642155 RepID=UPI002FD24C4D